MGCKLWYHIQCLQVLPVGPANIPTEVEMLTRVPGSAASYAKVAWLTGMLRTPIKRGLEHGVVGNGQHVMEAWHIFRWMQDKRLERLPDSWTVPVGIELGSALDVHHLYYRCPTCNMAGRPGFM